MPRNLRGLRKRQSIPRETCAACANVSANAAEPSAACANVSANAAKPSAACANVKASPAGLAGTPASIPQKRLDRYEASVDTLPTFFHRTHVTNEAPEMADLDRNSDTPTTQASPHKTRKNTKPPNGGDSLPLPSGGFSLRLIRQSYLALSVTRFYRLSTFIRFRKATVLWISLYITTSSPMKGTSLR